MSFLNGTIKLCLLRRNAPLLATVVRNAGAWNKDWKPGPYPTTQEERDLAAKRYGLHPKDYEPYPDDGTGFGDYPMFKAISVEGRDPFEAYDCPELRRNFGEVVHVDADMHTGEKVDCNKRYLVPIYKQCIAYVSIITFFFVLQYISEQHKMIKPLMGPQFPEAGKKHYTFEVDE